MIKPLEHWQDWGFESKPECLKKFEDGENHQSWLIATAKNQWVVKQFNHSFNLATHNQQLAAQHDLAPTVHLAQEPFLLMDYLAHQENAEHHNYLHNIGASLSDLHQKVVPSGDNSKHFDLFAFANDYLDKTNDIDKQWHRVLTPALQHFMDNSTASCFCHNDLVLENIIIGTDKVRFIDWEFAGLNNPWFDLAAIVLYAKLDETQSAELLASYRQGWDKKITDRIFISAQISHLWLDLVWHLSRSKNYRSENQHRFKHLQNLAKQFGLILRP